MDNQNNSDASEIHYTKVEVPQCEVVIEETENSSTEDSTDNQGDMITYLVIPNDMDPDQIVINYCDPEEESLSISDVDQNQCILCGESFQNCFLLQEHFSSMHAGNDLTCQICRLQCATDLQLMRHYNKHKYSCNLCEASFGKYEDLFNHKKTHSQTLPYACNICNEAYSSTREISLHIREKHNLKRSSDNSESIRSKKIANDNLLKIVKEERI
ncbi:hypothetical protein WA026_016962 [Henosepilachna vigintioctopunctata]|uniref:C2H2-type domain-containing protein n=1 Tax=Henosepilachna vigintioctopunctata TaxID=420089 RepID=A0AAW1UD81_9CUCU